MSKLFSPVRLGSQEFSNRIVISPMCQYSAIHGDANDWHLVHLGSLAMSGASLVVLEATAVEEIGRITHGDLGLYNEENEAALHRVLGFCRKHGSAKLGIQLGHAGRKASAQVPWEGGRALGPDADPWETVSASAIPFADDWHTPREASAEDIERIVAAFGAAAERAVQLGFEVIEVHGAHGYLLHQFLSPVANRRTDEYGGSLENRMRFPLEVFDAVRAAFPAERPVIVRVSATDWAEGGWDVESTIAFARALEARGCAAIHVSSGGLTPAQKIPVGPNYQVPQARAVREAVGVPVIAVGLITGFEQAEAIVGTGDADAIALARAILYDPRWPWHAAAHLGATVQAPNQYLRCQPRQHGGLFGG
jgi:2,4-dienoyl-CoA reductase-like NADH-dependent reductase (Old Yellow Enzyme family)